jgi:DNA-binding transcriptional MocR family regulator
MRLPTQRKIADYLGVTIATVTKAMGVAATKGLITTRAGTGTFIARMPPPQDDRLLGETVVGGGTQDLSLNAPPVSIVADILEENLKDLTGGQRIASAFDYDPIPGDRAHVAAACQWMSLRGYATHPENILITQGAHEALLVCLSALTRAGDTVLCERLSYTGLRRIGQLLRINLVGVTLDDDGLCLDAVRDAIAQHSPKAIVCTPVTQNPTTVTYSEHCKATLASLAESAGIPIIEDDIYGLFDEGQIPPLAAHKPDQVILVTSLSKTVASGIRIGYIASPQRWIPQVKDAMFALGWTAPSLQMAYATRLIESGRAEQCVIRHRAEAGQRLEMAQRILGTALRTPTKIPSYHVWVETGMVRPDDLSAELYREGIQVSPASHFLIGDGPVPRALRLSLGRAADSCSLELPLRLITHRLSLSRPSALGSIA